jgi:hypothetical protein
LLPFTCGAVAGWVWPAAMVTEAGEIATLGLLLDRLTVTAVEAATGRVTWNAADWPRFRETPVGRPMAPPLCTVTLVLPLEILDVLELAVMVADPGLTAVTGTVALVAPCAITTVEGTDTIPEGTALRLTVITAGAGADRVTVRFSLASPVMVEVGCVKLNAPLTVTFAEPMV